MKSKFFFLAAFFLGSMFLTAAPVFAGHPCNDPLYPVPVHEASGASVCRAASTGGGVTTIPALLTRLEQILNVAIPFIIGLAVFTIIWGIFIYITKAGEEEKRSEAKLYIVWGIIAVFSMLSIWGFVNILVNSFGIQINPPIEYPQAPTL